jgi:hypothetical protein
LWTLNPTIVAYITSIYHEQSVQIPKMAMSADIHLWMQSDRKIVGQISQNTAEIAYFLIARAELEGI